MVVIRVDFYDGEVQAKPFINPFKFVKGRAGGGFAVLGIHRKEHKGFCTLFYGLPYRSLYKGLPVSHGRFYKKVLGQNFLQGFCLGFCLFPLGRFASHQLVVVPRLFCPKEDIKKATGFWMGLGISTMSWSENRLYKKGLMASKESGPPMFKSRTAIFPIALF
jgi:hypothetical protein